MTHGTWVQQFEQAFAARVGARHAIAMTNGTVTLEVALRALGVQPGARVAVPPLTMAATSMAVLNVGAQPCYWDVDPETWLLRPGAPDLFTIAVSLYGLHQPLTGPRVIDDAAQTLRPHNPETAFTSYSLQRSKILQTGEGGVLVTNQNRLALIARSIASLGYDLPMSHSIIDSAAIKSPEHIRHVRLGLNARMNDVTAQAGLREVAAASERLAARAQCASLYRTAFRDCAWQTPQQVPEGVGHDYWAYTVALDTPARWQPFADRIAHHGGERPYGAWRLTFTEPAFHHVGYRSGGCATARDLQPRLMQFQTNDLARAAVNAQAIRRAIADLKQ